MDTKILCKFCKSEISPDATICPHCRKKTGVYKWTGGRKFIAGFLVIASIFIFISVSFSPEPPRSTPSANKLNGTLLASGSAVQLINNDSSAWSSCTLWLNGNYSLKYQTIEPGKMFTYQYSEFTDGDKRFNSYTTKPGYVQLKCQHPGGELSGYAI